MVRKSIAMPFKNEETFREFKNKMYQLMIRLSCSSFSDVVKKLVDNEFIETLKNE